MRYINMLKDNYYLKETKQGLKVYTVNSKKNTCVIELLVKYGGIDREYVDRITSKHVIIPEGTAHLIEHLVCNNLKKSFVKLNAKFNACTSKEYTKYSIEVNGDFKEPLKYLMNMVFKAAFTDEQIEKELKIVFSEMDLIGKKILVEDLLYKNNYKSSSVIGTREELYKVNAKLANNIYNNFYVPSNIAIFVDGNIVEEEVFKEVIQNLNNMNVKKCGKPKRIKKDLIFPAEHILLQNEVNKNEIALIYDKPNNYSSLDLYIAFELFSILKFYKTSDFLYKVKEQKLLSSKINFIYDIEDNYAKYVFNSSNPNKFKNELMDFFKKCDEVGISEEDFSIAKKIKYR